MRSLPRILAAAACGGLEPPPARRLRGAIPHLRLSGALGYCDSPTPFRGTHKRIDLPLALDVPNPFCRVSEPFWGEHLAQCLFNQLRIEVTRQWRQFESPSQECLWRRIPHMEGYVLLVKEHFRHFCRITRVNVLFLGTFGIIRA